MMQDNDFEYAAENPGYSSHHSVNISNLVPAEHIGPGSLGRTDSPQRVGPGLQDSKSPFKSVNEKHKSTIHGSPVVLVKKKGSAKYSQRKSSN